VDDTRLYHNPRCSKSRAALELLQARGVAVRVIPYLEEPPSVEELRTLLDVLALPARELVRRSEPAFVELGLGASGIGDEALLAAMATNPRLIERPVFVHAGRAVIGRPPERVLELLG
jgi:arsenate reductase